MLFVIILAVSHGLRKSYRRCVNILLNVTCMWIALPIYFAMNLGEAYLRMALGSDVAGRAIFAALTLLGASILYRVWSRMEKYAGSAYPVSL